MAKESHKIYIITLSLMLVVLAHGATTEVRADVVIITNGFVEIGGPFPPGRGTFRSTFYSIAGANFATSGGTSDGFQQDVMSGCIFSPCTVGTLVGGNSLTQLQGLGSATINGVTYDPIQPFGSLFAFSTPNVAIPNGGPTITVTTPFTMNGTLSIFAVQQQATVFSMNVSGSGIATLTLQQFESGYVLTNIRYDFEVPEPGALLLFGTGLAGAATKAWRRYERKARHAGE